MAGTLMPAMPQKAYPNGYTAGGYPGAYASPQANAYPANSYPTGYPAQGFYPSAQYPYPYMPQPQSYAPIYPGYMQPVAYVPVIKPSAPQNLPQPAPQKHVEARPEPVPVSEKPAEPDPLLAEEFEAPAVPKHPKIAPKPVEIIEPEVAPKTHAPKTFAEEAGQTVGGWVTRYLQDNPQWEKKLQKLDPKNLDLTTILNSPDSPLNGVPEKAQKSMFTRFFLKHMESPLVNMFPKDLQPGARQVLQWLRTKPGAGSGSLPEELS